METPPLRATDPTVDPDSRVVDVAVVIPAFNEREGVPRTLDELAVVLDTLDVSFEVVVVDDGSTDGTGDAAEACGVRVVRLMTNRGYGAALKAGIAATSSELVAIIDADGTYPADALPELLRRGGSHTGDLHEERHVGGRCPKDGFELTRCTVGGRTTYACSYHQRARD